MLSHQRIIFSDNGTLTDVTNDLASFANGQTASIPVTAAEDAIYIGSEMPFNHRWFEFGTISGGSRSLTVQIWDGTSFNNAVDVLDGTQGFTQSGMLEWATDRLKTWAWEETTESVTGLTSLKIYHLFWAKITWSDDLSGGPALAHIGHKFSNDYDLGSEYPTLLESDVMTGFEAGKTDWDEQHFLAAERVIDYIRAKRGDRIWTGDQIMSWREFTRASTHAVADIILRGFGRDYEDIRKSARQDFYASFNKSNLHLDYTGDGKLERAERRFNGSFRRV